MRLLSSQTLSLHEFLGNVIPPYAILSHTWGDEEVSFDDISTSKDMRKASLRKLHFCGKQAAKDGLEWFWVDTWCIDKGSSHELSEAINSMFQWYRDAVKCYVYLSDVSKNVYDDIEIASAFRQSRWFTRGWTLLELIAPKVVEFYTCEGQYIGSKSELEPHIHEVTGIPVEALRGAPLSGFSIDERLRWAATRLTRRDEDNAYCLLGIFDVHMPILYGEGGRRAMRRFKAELQQLSTKSLTELAEDLSVLAVGPLHLHSLADSEFRLFGLQPGKLGDRIVGSLQVFSLIKPPVYYALSYVWGQEPSLHRLVINGEENYIQPNLFHALLRIRSNTSQLLIWVDALCINQQNSSEKNMQVRQMANIYSQACSVLIWLGEEDSTSKFALSFVSMMLSKKFSWEGAWWEQYGFSAFGQILERPWFRRGWVLQEAAFSKSSMFHCGDRVVHMDQFVIAINTVRERLHSVPKHFSPIFARFQDSPAVRLLDVVKSSFKAPLKAVVRRRRLSLEHLVDMTTSGETTDQRDAIYALLNLANDIVPLSEPSQSDAIIPDYDKEVLDVFVEFIMYCCHNSDTLDVICRPWAPLSSTSVYGPGNEKILKSFSRSYPSWIASRDNLPFGNPSLGFKYRLHGNSLVCRSQNQVYNAHYGIKPQVFAGRSENGTCDGSLFAKGFVFANIAKTSTRMANAIITKDCLRILQLASHTSCTSFAEVLDYVWRILCANRDADGQRAPSSYGRAMLYLLRTTLETGDWPNLLRYFTSIDIEELLDTDLPEYVEDFVTAVRNVAWNRRIFSSRNDDPIWEVLVGLAPRQAKVGDYICILYGCSVPVVLRQTTRPEGEGWVLVGEAYVHGMMDGEAIISMSPEMRESKETTFRIF